MLDLGLKLNNQILPDMGSAASAGFPMDQGPQSDKAGEKSFQDLLQGKLDTDKGLPAETLDTKNQESKIDSVITKAADPKALEKPIVFAPELPLMMEAFPVIPENVAPMQKFLQVIDKEAGVNPEMWAQAMLTLTPDEQLQTPADTAKAVIGKLEIPGDKKEVVVKAYDKLLKQLQENDNTAQEISADAMVALAPMMAAAATLKEPTKLQPEGSRTVNTDKSLKFEKPTATKADLVTDKKTLMSATGKPVTEVPMEVETSGFELPKLTNESGIEQTKVSVEELKAKLESMPEIQMKSSNSPAAVNPEATSAIEKSVDTQILNASDMVTAAPSQTSELAGEEVASSKFLVDDKKFDKAEALSSDSSASLEETSVQNYKKLDLSDFKADTKSSGKKQDMVPTPKEDSKSTQSNDAPKFFIDNSQVSTREMPIRAEATTALATGAAAMTGQEDVNTQELIRQAQFMIRQGGGEVKIKLNPMNLGEVSMKMSVDGDKVQLALDTTTHEAKKLIEGSINELRATLTANKLSLEHVKVDVAGKSDNQFNNHRHDGDGGAARDQARQFLNNFRDDNQSRRSAMTRDSIEVPSKPAARSVPRTSYNRGVNASGRLNLVA